MVTGSGGQLGSEIEFLSSQYSGNDFRFHNSKSLDITDRKKLKAEILDFKPDYFINCAAYTAVDLAEDEVQKALKVNGEAVGNIAGLCKEHDVVLMHISTDYVFDGTGSVPYQPSDKCNPLGSYGNSKRQGELEILSKEMDAFIFRTSWVYSSYGKNFVKTMLRLGKERSELNVVSDQFGSPTYAADLAQALLHIVATESKPTGTEIHHYCNDGVCSWNEFAAEIMDVAELECEVGAITTAEYPTKAARPGYSVLDTSSLKERFEGIEVPNWKKALVRCFERLNDVAEPTV